MTRTFSPAKQKLYNRDHTPIPDTPLDPQFAQTLQSNKFGHLDTDTLPASGGPKLVADEKRRAAIKEAFVWSFEAYEKYAWGDDELQPLSMTGTNLTSVGAVGYTIIDSIGSLLVMDLIPQYKHARDWVRDSLDFDKDAQFNTFEVCLNFQISARLMVDYDPYTRRSLICTLPHFHPCTTRGPCRRSTLPRPFDRPR